MPPVEVIDTPWTRKHDDPRFPLIPQAPIVVYPTKLQDLIDICASPVANLRAAGSHWALSQAAISDHTFIETNDPFQRYPPMAKTLVNVIPSCLNSDYVKHMVVTGRSEGRWYLAHVESGKRICQLYAELDQPIDITDKATLAGRINAEYGDDSFGGPWAFATLGGAAGQTFAGAFSTGTHGGDFDRPPTPDSVLAIHLVADGGDHYWIEPKLEGIPRLIDKAKLEAEYGAEKGYATPVKVIRNTSIFNAAIVSVGRFGAIYSVVVKAVPQYSLLERRRLGYWQEIKEAIKNKPDTLFNTTALSPALAQQPALLLAATKAEKQRFLQIAVCMAPVANGEKNRIGITQRWTLPLDDAAPGRKERVGEITIPGIPGVLDPVFSRVGNSIPFTPDEDNPLIGAEPSMLEIACSNASFLAGIIEGVANEIKDFVESNGVVVGAGIAGVAALGGGGLIALIPQLALVLAILYGLLNLIDDDTRFGEVMNGVKNALLNPNNPDPVARAAGVFAWRMIYNKSFEGQQAEADYYGISYAMMDKHHYGNTCEVNVDCFEVFFDAVDSRLVTFVDALLAFEANQEYEGKSILGYASLRFMEPTNSLIGMERFPLTCSIEVGCLRDLTGGQELVDFAVNFASNPNINGIFHWGQRNDCNRSDIDRLFGQESGQDRIGEWRRALSLFTANGQRNAFSSDFTRRTGLEL